MYHIRYFSNSKLKYPRIAWTAIAAMTDTSNVDRSTKVTAIVLGTI